MSNPKFRFTILYILEGQGRDDKLIRKKELIHDMQRTSMLKKKKKEEETQDLRLTPNMSIPISLQKRVPDPRFTVVKAVGFV